MKHISYLVLFLVGLALIPACKRTSQLEQEAHRQDSIKYLTSLAVLRHCKGFFVSTLETVKKGM